MNLYGLHTRLPEQPDEPWRPERPGADTGSLWLKPYIWAAALVGCAFFWVMIAFVLAVMP